MSTSLLATIDPKFPDCVDISTEDLLSAFYGDARHPVQETYASWSEGQEKAWDGFRWESHFDSTRRFMEQACGMVCVARDNTYNGENDLSDQYVWEVWRGEDDGSDWVYAREDTIVVIYVHLGGDVRGNYGAPRFYDPEESTSEYVIPFDVTAEVWPVEIRDPNGDPVDSSDYWRHVEKWSNGYTSAPWYRFTDDCRIFGFTACAETVCAVTPDGYRMKVHAGVYVGS